MNIASWQRISVVLLVVMGLMVLYYQLGTNKPNTESHKPNSSTLKKPSCEPCPVCPTNTSKAEPSLYFPQNLFPNFITPKTDPPFLLGNFGDIAGFVRNHGSFQCCETSLYRYLLKEKCKEDPNALVVDVGANIGYFALYAAKFGCRVEAYEPTPIPSAVLNVSIIVNGLQSKVKSYYAAVGSQNGVARMQIESKPGLSKIVDNGNHIVPLIAVENVIKEDVFLLKVDTEGYEDEIFKGLEDLLDRYSIDHISVEILPRRDLDFKLQFLAKLMQKGYHVYTYHDFHTTELFIKNNWDLKPCKLVKRVTPFTWPRSWIMVEVYITKHPLPDDLISKIE